MIIDYADVAEWIFQVGLFAILVATLTYACRLDRLLRQVRCDRDALHSILPQIDVSISAAIIATDRLILETSRAGVALKEACESAETTTRKLDDRISGAARIISAAKDEITTSRPALTAVRPLTQRRPAKLQSRGERDLARMLLDVS
ncbi:MAG: hypothetical protein PHT60_06085 [Acidiphilium sp.]|nr:hypothetical protein [Acidiphilium sp.]MDD4935333.1 hypothetical protein [Acidiphilium sp.]